MAARKCVIGLLLCASVSALASETVRTSLRGLPLISEHRAKAGAQSCKAPGQSCVGMSGNENQMDVLRGGVQADEAMFTLHYRLRGWTKAYAHLSLDEGKTWTDKKGGPGTGIDADPEFSERSSIGKCWRVLKHKRADPKGSMRIVLHDGEGNWDAKPKDSQDTFYILKDAGIHVLKDSVLSKVQSGIPVLVVTDLDGTLVGDDDAQAEFFDHWERQQAIRGSELVFNTGRSIDSAKKLMQEKGLLMPRAIVGSVGTEVWWADEDGGFDADVVWRQGLTKGGKWDRELVCKLAKSFIDKDWAHFRPDDEQNDFKCVFGVRTERVQEMVKEMQAGIDKAGQKAQFIYSGHGDWNYLDVVCEGAGKLEAMVHVRKKLGFSPERTLACGDSGNDILMLSGQERGVAVGNSQEGLLQWIRTREETGSKDRLICATKGHARGILEALQVMGFA